MTQEICCRSADRFVTLYLYYELLT